MTEDVGLYLFVTFVCFEGFMFNFSGVILFNSKMPLASILQYTSSKAKYQVQLTVKLNNPFPKPDIKIWKERDT